jgi:hypothetical protein
MDMGTCRPRYRNVLNISHDIFNYFNQFNQSVRSPIRLDATFDIAGCDQTQKILKIKCMNRI